MKNNLPQEYIDKIKVGNSTISNEVCEKLRKLISSGEIAPGTAFPIETEFCEQLGIGRSSLRETYKVLESQGYIKRTKRGTFVNPPEKILQTKSLSETMKKSDFNDLIEFRVMFESCIAELAARRANPESIEELSYFLIKMKENKEDISELTKYDVSFHQTIAKASGNKLLEETMKIASTTFMTGTYEAFQIDTEKNVEQAIFYHSQILDAISKHDEDAARECMKEHIQTIKKRVGD